MAWTDAARRASAETRRRNKILNAPVTVLRRNAKGLAVLVKRPPSQRFKDDVMNRAIAQERVFSKAAQTKISKLIHPGITHIRVGGKRLSIKGAVLGSQHVRLASGKKIAGTQITRIYRGLKKKRTLSRDYGDGSRRWMGDAE